MAALADLEEDLLHRRHGDTVAGDAELGLVLKEGKKEVREMEGCEEIMRINSWVEENQSKSGYLFLTFSRTSNIGGKFSDSSRGSSTEISAPASDSSFMDGT